MFNFTLEEYNTETIPLNLPLEEELNIKLENECRDCEFDDFCKSFNNIDQTIKTEFVEDEFIDGPDELFSGFENFIFEDPKPQPPIVVIDENRIKYLNRQRAIARWKVKRQAQKNNFRTYPERSKIACTKPRHKGRFIKSTIEFIPVTNLQ